MSDESRRREGVVTVESLSLEIGRREPRAKILRDVSFSLGHGEMHALVGETGSGKSMTARSVIGLLPEHAKVTGGRICIEGEEMPVGSEKRLRRLRGCVLGMIFQNPRAALYPMRRVGHQMDAVMEVHTRLPDEKRRARVLELLDQVGIRNVERVARSYPHELSGGMAQRVVIAMVLIADPRIVIADEPTTGLDATVQRQILELLVSMQREHQLSVLMITHDLGIVAQYCDSVSVMHRGAIVEEGAMRTVLQSPRHDYTRRLLTASTLDDVHRHTVGAG